MSFKNFQHHSKPLKTQATFFAILETFQLHILFSGRSPFTCLSWIFFFLARSCFSSCTIRSLQCRFLVPKFLGPPSIWSDTASHHNFHSPPPGTGEPQRTGAWCHHRSTNWMKDWQWEIYIITLLLKIKGCRTQKWSFDTDVRFHLRVMFKFHVNFSWCVSEKKRW